MEEYLKKDYNCIEDTKYLKSTEDIENYFAELAYTTLECGQGFYESTCEFFCKIGDEFYEVDVEAEINSSKQDRGDRLYFVDYIKNVSYYKVEKPLPIERNQLTYSMYITDIQQDMVENFFKSKDIEFKIK